jgi:hypothetical protein
MGKDIDDVSDSKMEIAMPRNAKPCINDAWKQELVQRHHRGAYEGKGQDYR